MAGTESGKTSGSSTLMRFIIIGGIFLIGIVAGLALQTYLVAGTGEASVEISAPTLDLDVTPTPDNSNLLATIEVLEITLDAAENTVGTASAMQTMMVEEAQAVIEETEEVTEEPVVEATEEVVEEPVTEETEQANEEPVTEETEEVVEEPASEETEEVASDDQRIHFRISQEESEVRFSMGIPSMDVIVREDGVIGATSDVAGDIIIDLDNPSNSQLGLIRVNARTLTTDRSFLNPIIRGNVLLSAQDEYEFIEFQPTDLIGLPDSIAIGDTIEFQIQGDLTLLEVTNSIVFDVTVTLVAENRLEGSAITSIFHADFEMVIPAPPSFVDAPPVADEVFLEIDFVALEVEE